MPDFANSEELAPLLGGQYESAASRVGVRTDVNNRLEIPVIRASSSTIADIVWAFSHFNALTATQWYEICAAREAVFIVEQNCAFLDADGADLACWHLTGKVNGNLAAYCRVVPPGLKYTEPSIGRVVTTLSYRRGGFGQALLKEALRHCDEMFAGSPNKIGAQMHLEKFYASFGYTTTSVPYDEDGILHVEMVRSARG